MCTAPSCLAKLVSPQGTTLPVPPPCPSSEFQGALASVGSVVSAESPALQPRFKARSGRDVSCDFLVRLELLYERGAPPPVPVYLPAARADSGAWTREVDEERCQGKHALACATSRLAALLLYDRWRHTSCTLASAPEKLSPELRSPLTSLPALRLSCPWATRSGNAPFPVRSSTSASPLRVVFMHKSTLWLAPLFCRDGGLMNNALAGIHNGGVRTSVSVLWERLV